MFGAILKATNSSFQKGITFYRNIYVKKDMEGSSNAQDRAPKPIFNIIKDNNYVII